ncbi:MAG: MIP/aquaporin family protein [Acidimicrobiales bacterium]
MSYPLGRRVVVEGIGTALLVLFGAGSVVAALTVGAGALDYAGLGFIALAFGIVIAAVIYGFGAVSGAHINPAVTFSLAVTGRFPWAEFVPYVAAQLAGAAVGGFLIVAAFGTGAADLGGAGSTVLVGDVSYASGIVAEAIGTFLLVFTIMAVAVDPRAPKGWAGLMIGLAVAGAILVVGPLTGGSLNPARTFGPYLASALFGDGPPWEQFPLYWVGPLIGGAVAAVVYDVSARPRQVELATPAETGASEGHATSAESQPAGRAGET